jgi:hypothetical protein
VSPTGNYAYVSNRNNTLSWFVVDTSVKTAPALLSTINVSAYGGLSDVKTFQQIDGPDKYLVMSPVSTGSMLVYDVTTKTAPVLAFTIPTTATSAGNVVAVLDGLIYYPNRDNKALDVFNSVFADLFAGSITASQATFAKSISVAGADISKASGVTNDSGVSGASVKDALNTLNGAISGGGTFATATVTGSIPVGQVFTSANCSSTCTLTLPSAASVYVAGKTTAYTIKRIGSANVTISGAGGDLIDGASTAVLNILNSSLTLVATNTGWIII